MALTITKLKMWKDPGYTRGCLEVPPAGSKKLPSTPDYVLPVSETLRPHKATTLTELHLPIAYSQVFDMSYLYIEASDGAGSIALFGWITGIYQRSTGADGVTIMWDVDYWRSYSGNITWGSGIVKRCNDSTHKRPYPTHPRRWKINKMVPFNQNGASGPWVCVAFNKTTGTNPPVTSINYIAWHPGETKTYNGDTYTGMSWNDIMQGKIDEALHIAPSTITGVFILPLQPIQWATRYVSTSLGKIWYEEGYNLIDVNISLAATDYVTTDDMHLGVIVDPYGSIVGNVPYGTTVQGFHFTADIGTNSANAIISLKTDHTPVLYAHQQGPVDEVIAVPALSAPVNSNAYSEYIYSGQRDYDKLYAQMQRDETRIKGFLNVGTNAAGGAVGGAMAGGGIGAAAGAVAGVGLGALTAQMNYDFQGGFDDWYQTAKEALYANQTSNLLIGSGGYGWYWFYGQWNFVELIADDVSLAEYTADISLNGYETNISASSVSSYITGGGPLQIDNINLTGNVPPEAKQYIKNKLQSGVYIVENNPSGVVP